eukprot:m51a1_g3104 hypothetical protein (78) ;mRNA; r:125390-125879
MSEESLKKAFAAWDKNSDGYIDRSEVSEVLKTAGVPAAHVEKMTQEVIEKTDTNKDGRISFSEFKAAMESSNSFFKK